jgi:serine/threonine protein kinase
MADSAYPDALPSQYRLHWYVLERVLGQGGFGITYLARDTNLDQLVAIKEYLPVDVATRRADSTVRPRSEDQSERYRWGLDRFIREARTLAKFDHPSIVRVLSVFEQNSTAYMVMRFEEGENFAALLERKHTVSEAELMRVLLPVLDGLKLVHDAGFIHRDIKPDNIHIRADGSPVLLDFGSARHSMGHARTVTILVAPGYAPFEQYYSSGEDQGPWTDIYSLGATCYRAVAGVAPMDAIARSKGILGSTRELLVPAGAVGAGRYSERLLKAIDHALAFAEKDRPATIELWRKELVGDGPAAVAPPKSASPARAGPTPTQIPNPAKAPVVRTAALVAVVAAVAVIGGGIGAYMTLRGTKQAAPPVPPAPVASAKKDEQKILDQTAAWLADAAKAAEKKAAQEQAAAKAAERDAAERKAETEKRRQADAREAKAKIAAAREAARKAAEAQAEKLRAEEERRRLEDLRRKAELNPPKGDVAAFAYFNEFAKRGHPEAALRVAEMFEEGRGTVANPNWAYAWYLVAEHRGIAGARPKKEAIVRRLQPKDIEQAEKFARTQM